jgi:hypothetical protein
MTGESGGNRGQVTFPAFEVYQRRPKAATGSRRCLLTRLVGVGPDWLAGAPVQGVMRAGGPRRRRDRRRVVRQRDDDQVLAWGGVALAKPAGSASGFCAQRRRPSCPDKLTAEARCVTGHGRPGTTARASLATPASLPLPGRGVKEPVLLRPPIFAGTSPAVARRETRAKVAHQLKSHRHEAGGGQNRFAFIPTDGLVPALKLRGLRARGALFPKPAEDSHLLLGQADHVRLGGGGLAHLKRDDRVRSLAGDPAV